VSTAAGIAFALSWQLAVALFVIWLIVVLAFRISSLAALAAALALPPLGFYFLGSWPESWVLVPITLLLFWRHRVNIRKLIAGEERRIGEKSA